MTPCTLCHHKKGDRACGLCTRTICKKCSNPVKEGTFAYLTHVPEELNHRLYCFRCFDEKVAPVLADYEETMSRAKGVCVFDKTKGEDTRFMSRSEKELVVEGCDDERDTLMRLAFQAARTGCNVLVDVRVAHSQVRNQGYQTSKWSGRGIPTRVTQAELDRIDRRNF